MDETPKKPVTSRYLPFCLACGSDCCTHIQESHKYMLTPREVEILQALCNPNAGRIQDIAFTLGLSHGTLKVYIRHIYGKLGWYGASLYKLALWAIAHREQLGIPLPLPGQFERTAA